MYIAMNRFRVIKGSEAEFEEVWRSRDRHLDEMEGYVDFHLLKGPEAEDHTLYSSHTIWKTKDDFVAWTKSEQFRQAHKGAGDRKPMFLGHPQFEGFETVEGV
ncbi:heme-degrading monooxygenase HmoA [Kaistia hirudinis]|uniref:Heme-degrading monooxygenase HmoA n=1 Tax=Kaistia hirudinis TaxID=1293440 RepID=A0A840AR04_9HYPH|nr:antibiotic biosynthesis monooxygenase [Kaistia hirudinis]MBB3931291.1 heme-degrading monooxygenase HmoA [Kaistia hirudinis]